MIAAVAERAEMSKAEAKRAVDALDEIVLEGLGNATEGSSRRARSADGAGQAGTPRSDPRNPATGEEITIAPKPASVDVRARPLAKAKAALPAVQKARRRLAASNRRASR